MDEGAALLHSLERGVNQGVTSLVAAGMNPEPRSTDDLVLAKQGQESSVVCVCGFEEGHLVSDVKRVVTSLLYKWGLNQEFVVNPPITVEEDSNELFTGASHVALCCNWKKLEDFSEVYKIVHVYRQVRSQRGKFLLLVKEEDDVTRSPDDIPKACLENPEMRMLLRHRRIHQMACQNGRIRLNLQLEDTICDWIKSNGKLEHDVIVHMEYPDVMQILCREMKYRMPGLSSFCRLATMCVVGTFSVLLTLVFLFAITKEAGLDRDVTLARQYLRHSLEGMRSGKSEWGFGKDALAVAALQIDDPSWWLQGADRQRSADRLEIGLLAVLTRLPARELTPQTLSLYIMALQSLYINPKDFHGNNLVQILHSYWLHYGSHGDHSSFSMATSVLALCNMDEEIPAVLMETLVSRQRADGSYSLGLDETAMVTLSLLCCHGDGTEAAVERSLTYLSYQRQKDGSYGGVYTTALILQVFNATRRHVTWEQYQSTLDWIVRRMRRSPELKSLEVTVHALLALAGKSLLNIANKTAFSHTRWQNERAKSSHLVSVHHYMTPEEVSQSEPSIPYSSPSLLEMKASDTDANQNNTVWG